LRRGRSLGTDRRGGGYVSHDDLLYRLLADALPAALPRAPAEQLLQSLGW